MSETIEADFVQNTLAELSEVMPSMSVQLPENGQLQKVVTEESLLGIWGEVLDNLRSDRDELSDFINNFAEMVINDGDSTTASKEALVNLLKIKTDLGDKHVKVAELMTRVLLKERDTTPKNFTAQQNNNITIAKRELLKHIEKAEKKQKGKKNDD